jgi:cytochrome c peroxidase
VRKLDVDKRPDTDFIKAFMHNGWFKSLKSVVHFYNTADVNPAPPAVKKHNVVRCPAGVTTEKDALKQNCWPAPEYPNVLGIAIAPLIGNLGLTPEQEDAIIAYLKTYTDT